MSRHGKTSTDSAKCGANTWCSTLSSSARVGVPRWRPTSSGKCWNAWAKNHGIGCPKMMSQRKMKHPCMLLGKIMTIWVFQSLHLWQMPWCCWKLGLTTLYRALGRQTPSFFWTLEPWCQVTTDQQAICLLSPRDDLGNRLQAWMETIKSVFCCTWQMEEQPTRGPSEFQWFHIFPVGKPTCLLDLPSRSPSQWIPRHSSVALWWRRVKCSLPSRRLWCWCAPGLRSVQFQAVNGSPEIRWWNWVTSPGFHDVSYVSADLWRCNMMIHDVTVILLWALPFHRLFAGPTDFQTFRMLQTSSDNCCPSWRICRWAEAECREPGKVLWQLQNLHLQVMRTTRWMKDPWS